MPAKCQENFAKHLDKYTWQWYARIMPSKLVISKGGILMNREEILARSQRENQGQDVVDLEVSKAGMKLGWLIVVCLLAFVSVVDAIVFERMNSEVFFAVLAATSAVFFSKYLKLRKRHELIIAIIEAVAAAAFLISWILQLVH
jgi:hypothetical protein